MRKHFHASLFAGIIMSIAATSALAGNGDKLTRNWTNNRCISIYGEGKNFYVYPGQSRYIPPLRNGHPYLFAAYNPGWGCRGPVIAGYRYPAEWTWDFREDEITSWQWLGGHRFR